MAWATVADVATYTGVTASASQVAQAQGVVELFADTDTDATDAGLVSTRNLALLTKAVAYQAAWMTQHPDVFTNMDVSSFSQDGASGSPAHANAALLAPLARRCIDRLTWRLQPLHGHKPIRMLPRSGSLDSSVRDDNLPWLPLPSGYPS